MRATGPQCARVCESAVAVAVNLQVGGDLDPSKVIGDEGGLVSNHAYSMLEVYATRRTVYVVRCTQTRRKSAAPTRPRQRQS